MSSRGDTTAPDKGGFSLSVVRSHRGAATAPDGFYGQRKVKCDAYLTKASVRVRDSARTRPIRLSSCGAAQMAASKSIEPGRSAAPKLRRGREALQCVAKPCSVRPDEHLQRHGIKVRALQRTARSPAACGHAALYRAPSSLSYGSDGGETGTDCSQRSL